MLVHSIHSDWIKKLIFHLRTRKKLALLLPSIHTASNTIPIYFKFHSTTRKKRENIEESFHMVYFFWAIFLRRNCNENLFWLKDLLSSLRGIGMCKNHKIFMTIEKSIWVKWEMISILTVYVCKILEVAWQKIKKIILIFVALRWLSGMCLYDFWIRHTISQYPANLHYRSLFRGFNLKFFKKSSEEGQDTQGGL